MCAYKYISTSLFQILPGRTRYLAEYIIVEANCTDGICEPLNDPLAVSTETYKPFCHVSKNEEVVALKND